MEPVRTLLLPPAKRPVSFFGTIQCCFYDPVVAVLQSPAIFVIMIPGGRFAVADIYCCGGTTALEEQNDQ